MTIEYILLTGQNMAPFTNTDQSFFSDKYDDQVGRFKWAILEDGEFHGSIASASAKQAHVKSGDIVEQFKNVDKQLQERFMLSEEQKLQYDLEKYYTLFQDAFEKYHSIRSQVANILLDARNRAKNGDFIQKMFSKNKETYSEGELEVLIDEFYRLMYEELETPWSAFGRKLDDERMARKFKHKS